MALINIPLANVLPSDVFGYEVNTDVGYGRETFTITVAPDSVVRVGTILEVDYATRTAAPLTIASLSAGLLALGDLAVFVGRDTPTNPVTAQDYENLTMTATGDGVVIAKGDGRGILKKGYLDIDGTSYYDIATDIRAPLDIKLTKENRFKMVEQQRPVL